MQPMRAKNRVTVMAGVALLAVVVGGFALWQSRKSAESKPNTNTVAMTDNAATAASTTPDTQTTTPSATAGNTGASATPSTPAQTDGSAAAGATTKLPATYVVQPGDTLSTISMKFYNSDKYYGDIEAANELEDANHLMAGQTLTIPELPSVATATQGQ